ncbi:MAG: type IV pilus assembly protein PilM [Candidatus Falkowbacteria bacterium]
MIEVNLSGVGRNKNLIGIDIGASGIKFVELEETETGLYLKGVGIEPLPPAAFVDGAIMDFSVITEVLKRLVEKNGLRGRRAALSVGGHRTILKNIFLPEMTMEELARSIAREAEPFIPWAMDEVNFDYFVINPEHGQGQMAVGLVVCKKDVADDLLRVAGDAGLLPVVVDSGTLAAANVFLLERDFETVAIIDIGTSMTQLAILSNGKLVFTRDSSFGSMLAIEEIQRARGLAYEDADAILNGYCKSGIIGGDSFACVGRVVNLIVTEIQRGVQFFTATNGEEKKIERVLLCGGGSLIPEMEERFSSRLNIPVALFDPFVRIKERKEVPLEKALRLVVAVGLALRKG